MEFRKCIELNALVKAHSADRRAGFDRVNVSFSSYDTGRWAAVVRFPHMMFSPEIQEFLGWALANCSHPFLGHSGDDLVLHVL